MCSSRSYTVKLQKRDPDTFYSKDQLNEKFSSPFGTTFADYRNALELTYEDFQFVMILVKNMILNGTYRL